MPSTVEASHTPRRCGAALPLGLGLVGVGELTQGAAARRRRVGPGGGRWPPAPVRPRRPGGGCLGPGPGCGPGQLAGPHRLGGARQRAADQGPGGPHDAAGRAGAHPEPAPQPGRGRADRQVGFGAGRAAPVSDGEFFAPSPFQPVRQPTQRQHPGGPDGVGQHLQVPGGQPVRAGGQGGQLVWLPAGRPDRRWVRMCVRVHSRNLSTPPQRKHQSKIGGHQFRGPLSGRD